MFLLSGNNFDMHMYPTPNMYAIWSLNILLPASSKVVFKTIWRMCYTILTFIALFKESFLTLNCTTTLLINYSFHLCIALSCLPFLFLEFIIPIPYLFVLFFSATVLHEVMFFVMWVMYFLSSYVSENDFFVPSYLSKRLAASRILRSNFFFLTSVFYKDVYAVI